MKRNIEKEIMEVLEKFQKGYTERNIENIDAYVEELFCADSDVRAMGTSTGEMCLGVEDVKELIEGDWKYWGDVRYDLTNPTIIEIDEGIAFIALKGSVEKYYKFDREKLESNKEFIFDQINFDNLDSNNVKEKVIELNWILTQWGIGYGENNENNIPLITTGILKDCNGKWKFKQMKCSVPTANVPDYLFMRNSDDSEAKKLMKDFKKNCYGEVGKIGSILSLLQSNWNESEFNNEKLFDDIFSKNKSLLICPQGEFITKDEECTEKLRYLKEIWHELNLDKDSAIINTEKNSAWAMTLATVKTKISKDKLMKSLLLESKDILESNTNVLQKHITILRHISSAFMIENVGEEFEIPVRVELYFSKEESWKINYMQISYAHEWIYENKNEKFNIWGK